MRFLCGFILLSFPLAAQGVVGSGYTAPAPVSVAPGQIATFYVSGALSSTSATAAGIIGVQLQQNGTAISVPVQSLRSVSLCPNVTSVSIAACGSQLLAITIQIPYELVPFCPTCAYPVSYVPPLLLVSVSGQTESAIQLTPLEDEVHILTQCDVALIGTTPQPNYTGLPCAPLVTHADGTMVTTSSPASLGEALTAWVFGLGQTTPPATTGKPVAAATPAAETFNLNFNFSINALPTDPYAGEPDVVPIHPAYSGLAPGYAGLYQVNFVVPQGAPNGIEQCGQPGAVALGGVSPVQSNLTVSIGGQFSFDGAGICVATQIPVD